MGVTDGMVAVAGCQGMQAVAVVAALHLAPITDLAWSCDGAILAASSKDGYCSMTAFAAGELGASPSAGLVPPHIARRLLTAAKAVPPRQGPTPPPHLPFRLSLVYFCCSKGTDSRPRRDLARSSWHISCAYWTKCSRPSVRQVGAPYSPYSPIWEALDDL